ncbi:dehydrogenase/reductase SDR family member 4-like isoform X3 [Planococcus citri]|uniref:dehydrogenase/reductase SDR family member 4-like isoform X3 n=1 Tax=Planococcus citri TaxID=170843 RepID=UPI0031FA3FC6
MGRLTGKVAIITGSTQGIGFAIANKLATEGAKVVISSRQEVNVNEAVEKLKNNGHQNNISGVVCHVGNKEDRKRLYEECPEDKWDKLFDTNVKSAFLLTKEVVPHLKERKGGSIINISSLAGLQPVPMHGPYCVSKTAILGLTRVFADELAQFNIRVNCIAPGLVRTKFAEHIYENKILHDAILSQIPMGRTGEPRDVEGIAAFLCSDDANYITGETIAVAGGMHTRL